jgi:hypothetical protein
MKTESLTLVILVVLPLVAVVSLGFLVQEVIEGGVRAWPVWLVLLALSCGVWSYYFFQSQ